VAFLQQYQHEFKCDTEKGIVNFNDTRDSAHDGYTTPYQTLGDYVGFLWGEIATREYWWTRDAEKAKLVKTLTCSDLAEFYQTHFMDSHTTRELTTMVFSPLLNGEPLKDSDLFVGNTTFSTASGRAEERLHPIRSIEEYRRENHNYYPLHIDWYRTSAIRHQTIGAESFD